MTASGLLYSEPLLEFDDQLPVFLGHIILEGFLQHVNTVSSDLGKQNVSNSVQIQYRSFP